MLIMSVSNKSHLKYFSAFILTITDPQAPCSNISPVHHIPKLQIFNSHTCVALTDIENVLRRKGTIYATNNTRLSVSNYLHASGGAQQCPGLQ